MTTDDNALNEAIAIDTADATARRTATAARKAAAFRKELESLLNRYSRESASNTPDWILAGVMLDALRTFECATRERGKWYGKPTGASVE